MDRRFNLQRMILMARKQLGLSGAAALLLCAGCATDQMLDGKVEAAGLRLDESRPILTEYIIADFRCIFFHCRFEKKRMKV